MHKDALHTNTGGEMGGCETAWKGEYDASINKEI
jgi:hypothetical protein